jgi:hypothetical protein
MEIYTSIRIYGTHTGHPKTDEKFHKNVGKPYYPEFHRNVRNGGRAGRL